MASSDELLDDTNAEIPAESQDKSKTEFLNRVKETKSEIKTKFQNARKKLDEKELKILKRVEKIEKEIIDDYEKNASTLKEITQAKEQLLGTFKSNTTNILLKKNLEIIDKEIEEIKKNSKIDSTIELVWKMEQLDLSRDDMCQVSINIKSSSPKIPTNQAEGGNLSETSEPSNKFQPKTLKLSQTQFQPLPSWVQKIQSNQPRYQKNPGQIPANLTHGQPERSGQMPPQMAPENTGQREFNVQGPHQMQTNPPQPIPSQHPQVYFIRPRQVPDVVSQLYSSIRGLIEKEIGISLHNTIPGELNFGANECLKLAAQDKFSHSIVCDIIIASLKNKPIKEVEIGLSRLASFTLNILTDLKRFTGNVFQVSFINRDTGR